MNKFTLKLDGESYDIERRTDMIVVSGIEFPMTAKDGNFLLSGNPHTVKLSEASAEVNGISYAIEAIGLEEPKQGGTAGRKKAANGPAADEAGAITAVMPGLIIKVMKNEGDKVEVGETVLILEAMKMQNEIQAKVAGTVKQVCVKQGENVEIRQVLMVVE